MNDLVRWARTIGWLGVAACGSAPAAPPATTAASVQGEAVEPPLAAPAPAPTNASVVDLVSLREDPARFSWFDFKPGVKKLILSGAPDSRHVAVLWYFEAQGGAVPLHYHEQTESIYVIDGAQSDAKGRYTKGSFYFNPPGSGHELFDSAGLFLLSYAAPPDFKRVADIGPYHNLVIGSDYAALPLAPCEQGSACYALPLAASGGMVARFVKPADQPVAISANALVVLRGACRVEGAVLRADTLVVPKSPDPVAYPVARDDAECLVFALAFQ